MNCDCNSYLNIIFQVSAITLVLWPHATCENFWQQISLCCRLSVFVY